jgi:hypothetical protein
MESLSMTDNLQGNARKDRASRASQAARLLAKLESVYEFSLSEILEMKPHIAQHGARFAELRALGHRIINRRDADGGSYYRLVKSNRADILDDLEIRQQVQQAVEKDGEHEPGFLFPREEVRYVDPEESR